MTLPAKPATPPPTWAIVVAFAMIYLSWGTTYLAMNVGVREERLPPALFGGSRVLLAGLVLLAFQIFRRQSVAIGRREFFNILLVSWLLFVGGNGLMNAAQETVNSGISAVLAATTPIWLGLFAMFWPREERLGIRGWLGLLMGLAGVLILLTPRLGDAAPFALEAGPFLILGSAAAWALGSLVLRHVHFQSSHLTVAAYQMIVGGASLTLLGIVLGETQRLPERITFAAAFTFSYLLIVGSLIGFVAFNWLLGHVSATKVGTYAYVNPVVAVLIGWALANEAMTLPLWSGIGVILLGVFLIRGGNHPPQLTDPASECPPDPT